MNLPEYERDLDRRFEEQERREKLASAGTPTPGQWQVVDDPFMGLRVMGESEGDTDANGFTRDMTPRICEVDDNEFAVANARLIAAAPDLLRELTHLAKLLEPALNGGHAQVPGLATVNGAWLAIAKATKK